GCQDAVRQPPRWAEVERQPVDQEPDGAAPGHGTKPLAGPTGGGEGPLQRRGREELQVLAGRLVSEPAPPADPREGAAGVGNRNRDHPIRLEQLARAPELVDRVRDMLENVPEGHQVNARWWHL